MDVFKKPSAIPQDLLLIQEFVDTFTPSAAAAPTLAQEKPSQNDDDDIDSSASESDSEDEVEADLLNPVHDCDDEADKDSVLIPAKSLSPSSDSDSDSSDSDEDMEKDTAPPPVSIEDDEDADEEGGTSGPVNYLATKNEIEPAVSVPEIESVGADEVLELVGEIVNIMDQVVVVRGQESDIAGRGSDKALDSGTLLVFEDRTVFGHIHDTFGPTTQPLYQIRFTKAYPVQPDRVYADRKVYHIPQRSHFVFVSQINKFKGSDASNVHDEEPGEDELEFSDDEAEAEHKRALKQRRASSRAPSSRASTPSFRAATLTSNPYDESSPYDDNFGAGPSRPAPAPYDDPYAEEYTPPVVLRYDTPPPEGDVSSGAGAEDGVDSEMREFGSGSGRMRDHGGSRGGRSRGGTRGGGGRGGGPGGSSGGGRDRSGSHSQRGGGRQQRRQQNGRGRGGQPQRRSESTDWMPTDRHTSMSSAPSDPPRPLSPTSLAIARATGQYMGGDTHAHSYSGSGGGLGYDPIASTAGWYGAQQPSGQGFFPHTGNVPTSDFTFFPPQHSQQMQQMQMQMGQMGQHNPYAQVQPHINPRFASALGFGVGAGAGVGFPPFGGMGYPPQQGQNPMAQSQFAGGADRPSGESGSEQQANEGSG